MNLPRGLLASSKQLACVVVLVSTAVGCTGGSGAAPSAAQPRATPAPAVDVSPAVETTPSPGDADDPAIWVHPTDPSLSLVIGTDKRKGLGVYDLAGKEVQFLDEGSPNNVDLRDGFRLGDAAVSIVVAVDDEPGQLRIYVVDVAARRLVDVAARRIRTGVAAHGVCLYASPRTGRFYAFPDDLGGRVEQWELFATPAKKVDARKVRGPWDVGSAVEGCVADEATGRLYVGEEEGGIWAYGAEPTDSLERTQVDTTGAGGHLVADVEGLAILPMGEGDGLLLASSQGDNSFVAYRRTGTNDFVARFRVRPGSTDGCEDTDGIEVVNTPLGSAFPKGLFVCQDGENSGGTNFKFVPLERVTTALPLPRPV
jgi:3-phytase